MGTALLPTISPKLPFCGMQTSPEALERKGERCLNGSTQPSSYSYLLWQVTGEKLSSMVLSFRVFRHCRQPFSDIQLAPALVYLF